MREMSSYVLLILCGLHTVYPNSHSLRYYYTGVSAPGSGLPEFSIVGYVDDQQIDLYSSDTKTNIPVAPWMKKDPEYWERETDIGKRTEPLFKHDVKTAMSRFNQTEGFHFYQVMYGCELRDDGGIVGYEQHGYDGREFLFLDTQTGTFIPSMRQALITTEKINSPEVQAGMRSKYYLEDECITALVEYVESGREDLERRVQPQVKVSGQEKGDILMLHCQVYGFHPRQVHVKWMKNGTDDLHSYETTHTLPNPDGTYQIRVSAEVNPKEGESYSCYVDHSSLAEPLNVVWVLEAEPEEPNNPNMWVMWVITVVITVVVLVILLAAWIGGFLLYKKAEPKLNNPNMWVMWAIAVVVLVILLAVWIGGFLLYKKAEPELNNPIMLVTTVVVLVILVVVWIRGYLLYKRRKFGYYSQAKYRIPCSPCSAPRHKSKSQTMIFAFCLAVYAVLDASEGHIAAAHGLRPPRISRVQAKT